MERKKCVLDANRLCDECGRGDDLCDLDPTKVCDNCMKCVYADRDEKSDYAQILIDAVYENGSGPEDDTDAAFGTGEGLEIAGAEELKKYEDKWKDV